MKSIYFYLSGLILSVIVSANSQVVINEIQYSPVNGEPEWIELFNYSDIHIELKNPRLEDAVGSKVIPTFDLMPNQYAIITKDTLTLKSKRAIPENALMVQASIPTYNNDWDIVVLRNSDSTVIDSLYYNDKWGRRGISLERIDWSLPALSQQNLVPSISSDSATAGYQNSVARKDYDAGIYSGNFNQALSDYITFIIKNFGRNTVDKLILNIFIDIDRDTHFGDNEKLASKELSKLEPGDSLIITYNKESLIEFINNSGKFSFNAFIDYTQDQKSDNDTLHSSLFIPYRRGTILINEFMYDVTPQMSVFVELWNTSSEAIILDGWFIHDQAADDPSEYYSINSESFAIQPESYCVIAWDSLIFSKFPELVGMPNVFVKKSSLNLNHAGDELVVKDPLFNTIDSLYYLNTWHNKSLISTKDVSLEKINMSLSSTNPSSWASCTDAKGATPGKLNSSYYEIINKSEVSANPNPFSPYSNGKDNLCIISYNFPFKQSLLNTTIFDIHGYIVRKLTVADLISSSGAIVWDGKNDEGFVLPVGPYILFLEAADSSSDEIINEKLMIVIGKQE